MTVTVTCIEDYKFALDLLKDVDNDLTPTQGQQLMDYRYASLHYLLKNMPKGMFSFFKLSVSDSFSKAHLCLNLMMIQLMT